VNASPEPATNIAVSLAEDGFVVGLVLLLLTHPLLGLGLALAALLAILVVLALLLRLLFRRKRARA
jgi:O-antigen ligase